MRGTAGGTAGAVIEALSGVRSRASDRTPGPSARADTSERWVTAQGGCIFDAWAAILTSKECEEHKECMENPEPCD